MLAAALSSTNLRWGSIVFLAGLTAVSWRRSPVPLHELKRRLPMCLAGLCLFGLGISCFFSAHLGVAPWDVLHMGISKHTGLDVGLVINLGGIAVLLLWIPLRERPGLGTVLNALVVGLVVDLVKPRLPDAHAIGWQLASASAGLVAIACATGLYLGSGLGAGPRDGLMMGLRRLGLSVRVGRTIVEVSTLTLGLLLGGKVGFGTLLFLVGIGPLVQITLRRFSMSPLGGLHPFSETEPAVAPIPA